MQDLAYRGWSWRSMATTRKVGCGQNSPPRPMTVHSCTVSWSSATEERKLTRDWKPSGKMYPWLYHPGSALQGFFFLALHVPVSMVSHRDGGWRGRSVAVWAIVSLGCLHLETGPM